MAIKKNYEQIDLFLNYYKYFLKIYNIKKNFNFIKMIQLKLILFCLIGQKNF